MSEKPKIMLVSLSQKQIEQLAAGKSAKVEAGDDVLILFDREHEQEALQVISDYAGDDDELIVREVDERD